MHKTTTTTTSSISQSVDLIPNAFCLPPTEPQLSDLPFEGVTIDGIGGEQVVAAGSTIRLVCRSPPVPAAAVRPQHHPQYQHRAPASDEHESGGGGPLVSWLLDGRPLSDAGGGGGGDLPPGGVGRPGGGVNVLTELSAAGIVSTMQLAAASEADAGAYECRVRDIGADLVRVQVVRKGGGGGGGGSAEVSNGE